MSDSLSKPLCVLCSVDLFFMSRIVSTADSLGIQVDTVSATENLAAEKQADCILLDLAMNGLDVPTIMDNLPEEQRPTVIAFGAHVQGHKLKAAQEAGCDVVLTKNQFTNQLADLLKEYCISRQSSI